MSYIFTSLDIGSSQVKAVVIERRKDGVLSVLSVFKHPSSGFRKGVLVDIEDATHFLREIIVDLRKVSKQAVQNIWVNVNSEFVKARPSRAVVAVSRADRGIEEDDVERVLQASQAIKSLPNYQVLHNVTREYFVDDVGDIQDPVGMTGNRLEVSTMIIEVFSPKLAVLVKALERVGAGVSGLIFNPLAASRAVLSKRQKELGVLMIDFGFGTTSLAVYEEGKLLHTKCLPIGGSYVTNDIAVGLKIPVDIAEKLKLMYGYAFAKEVSRRDIIALREFDSSSSGEVSRRFLSEIIEVRLAELLELINNEVKSLGRPLQLPGGVVVTGGGVKLPGMTDLIKHHLRLPVQIGLPDLSLFEIVNPTYQEVLYDSDFSVAIGLALWGSEEETPHSFEGFQTVKRFLRNLIP